MARMQTSSSPPSVARAVNREPAASHATTTPRRPIAILGIPFDPLTMSEALDTLAGLIASQKPNYVVTANVDFLVQARRDVELRHILREAPLVLCDGTPLVWASRVLGNPLPARVAGADLVPPLLSMAEERGWRVFLLGAAEGVAARAAARLRESRPSLVVAGHYSPPFGSLIDMDHAQIVDRVRAARADIVLVSFGCPKQEKWIAMHYRTLGSPLVIGVGATIDFLAGRVHRAPRWMSASGTEWIYRLAVEPRRLFRRYAGDLFGIVPAIAAQWWTLRPGRRRRPGVASASSPEWPAPDSGCLELRIEGSMDAAFLESNAPIREALQTRQINWFLDMEGVDFLDSTAAGTLVRWHKDLKATGHHLVLLKPSRAVVNALSLLQLQDAFPTAPTGADARRLVVELERARPPVVPRPAVRPLAWRDEVTADNVGAVWDLTTRHLRGCREAESLCVIDLSGLRFIDSAGLGLMLRVQRWAAALPMEVRFSNPTPDVRNALQLAHLESRLLGR